jgi:peptidase A4-like protein
MKPFSSKVLALAAAALLLAGCAAPAGASGADVAVYHAAYGRDAIEQVIRQANDEQQQAFNQNNPRLMQDTATPEYYQQMVQTNAKLAAGGVQSITLLDLRFGSVSVNGASAQATTLETWRTTLADGSADTSTDQNAYTLTQQGGAWKVASDDQPGSSPLGPPPAQPGASAPDSHRSVNWSGYEATGGKFTSVTGSWTVPQVSGAGADAAWVGIGGVSSRDLIQAGTQASTAGDGQVQYQAWIETLPQTSRRVPLAVAPGDSVTVTLSEQSPGQWQVSLKDNTSGQSYSTTRQYASSESSAEWVEEAPSTGLGVVSLDNFGSVNFSGASAVENGKTVTVSQANGQGITMINRSGQVLAAPSALGSDGSSFSISRTQASSSAPGGSIRVRVRPVPLPFPIGIGF